MAMRTFSRLGNSPNRCIFSTVQYEKLKGRPLQAYKQIREFKRLVRSAEERGLGYNGSTNAQKPALVSRMWKPFAFTMAFSGTAFATAAIMEYERVRKHMQWPFSYYNEAIVKHGKWRQAIHTWWSALSDAEKLFIPICLINTLILLAWHIPRYRPILMEYFTTSPMSRNLCWPMLFSTFSHSSLLHLMINMYALHSFLPIAVYHMGKEQTMACYLSAGVFSNMISYLYKLVIRSTIPSVGASGALMGLLGYICLEFPNMKFQIMLLPIASFSASTALSGLLALDITGCILRWTYIDHAAHLGGVMFGVFWQQWGRAHLWPLRAHVLKIWQQYREPRKPYW